MSGDVESLVLAGRVDLLIERASRASGIGEHRYLVDAIERGMLLSDPGGVTAAARRGARALGVDADIAELDVGAVPPHAVLVPFLAPEVGFARLLYIAWQPDDARLPGLALTWETRRAVDDALTLAAEEVSPPRDRAGYRLTAAQPAVVSAFEVEGRSLAAAVFVSAVALWSRRSVRPGTLISGDLQGKRVVEVGGLTDKLRGAIAGHDRVQRVVVPTRNLAEVRAAIGTGGIEVEGVADAKGLLSACLEDAPRQFDAQDAVDEARRAFTRGWQGYRWPAQREPLLRLAGAVPDRRPDLRAEVLTMLGAVTRHLGAPEESLLLLQQAEEVIASEIGRAAVPDRPICELLQHRALTLRQLSRFEESAADAERGVEIAQTARLRGQLLKAHGCAGLVALSRERFADAVMHQRAALELVVEHRPQSAPRTGGYLVEALGRAGDLAEAGDVFEASLATLRDLAEGAARDTQEAWLRIAYAGVLNEGEDPTRVTAILSVPCVTTAIESAPLPGLLGRRWLGLAKQRAGDAELGLSLLADSPVAYGRAQLPHVRFLAHLNVLYEARARLDIDAFGADAASRVRIAIDALPSYGDTRVLLAEPTQRVLSALNAGEETGHLAAALDRLLSQCARIQ